MNKQNLVFKKRLLTITVCVFSTSSLANGFELSERTQGEFSGKITGALIADSDVSGIGSNNLSNGLFGNSDEGNIAIDTTLTRFNFGTHTDLKDNESLKSFVSLDFNGSNSGKMDLRMREAYVSWGLGNGELTVGQTWSTLMDLNRFPDTLLEPTITGVVFTRQPMVRWSHSFGTFRYDLALESGSNRVMTEDSETTLDNAASSPDFIFGIQQDTDKYWLRLSGLVNKITTKNVSINQTYNDNGWAFQLSGGIKFNEKDHFQLSYFNSHGNDRYVLGVSQTGPLFTPDSGEFHLRESHSFWGAIGHSWTDTLKSTIGYGAWQAQELEWQSDTFTKTQFGLANLKWTARENLTLGVEYNYTSYDRSKSEDRDNHRLIFSINYDF